MKLRFRKPEPRPVDEPSADARCPHTALVPRWDAAGDIGRLDRASAFHCEACGRHFSPREADALRASEARRLRSTIASEGEEPGASRERE